MSSKSFGSKSPALPHLVRGSGGLSGEITDLRADVEEAFGTLEALDAGAGPIAVQEWTTPVAAAAAGLEAATATTVAPRTVTSFVAGGVAALAAYPRNVTFTTAGTTPASAPATALVTGTFDGETVTETVTLAQTAATAASVRCFDSVTSVAFAAADGTDATVSIGFGAVFGLSAKAMSRAGGVGVLSEVVDGAQVTTGTFSAASVSAPNGSYAPATAPNGVHSYAVYFEKDMA